MKSRSLISLVSAVLVLTGRPLLADEYSSQILPFMQKYCVECHVGMKAKGELDLDRFSSNGDVVKNFRRWKHIIEFIEQAEMPPEESLQPSITESNAVIAAIKSILITEARKHAGDPGVILPRRLSNSEFNHAIHDLTGVNIKPTESFPADPAGGEGFDNTGESLRMSPNLVKKYLGAAQLTADHLVLKPDGIVFAPFPVLSYNERKTFTEQAVIDFYESHTVDIGSYLELAWRYRYRPDSLSEESIDNWSTNKPHSPKYLAMVWKFLNELDHLSAIDHELKQRWDAIPPPDKGAVRPLELQQFIDFVSISHRLLAPPEPELIKSSAGNWPISHLDYRAQIARKRDQFDATVLKTRTLVKTSQITEPDRKTLAARSLFIKIDHGFTDHPAVVVIKGGLFTRSDRLPRNENESRNDNVESFQSVLKRVDPKVWEALQFGRGAEGEQIDAESFVINVPDTIEIRLSVDFQRELKGRRLLLPCELDEAHSLHGSVLVQTSWDKPPSQRWNVGSQHLIVPDSPVALQLMSDGEQFCNTFPNRFYYVNENRGLAAGFHLVEGFFRDDRPLVEKVLSDRENAELNRLWQELDFVTESSETLLRGFVWFERSEREVLHDERFDFLRSEDPDLIQEKLLGKFERLYLDKMGIKRVGDTLEAESPDAKYKLIHGFFDEIRQGLTTHSTLREQAEERGLEDLDEVARRAWRRALLSEEQQSLRLLYEELRHEGQSVEAALRGVLTAVLMSPHFLYYAPHVSEGTGVTQLRSEDLATRLSLFLWSSLPDEELLTTAEQGLLQNEVALLQQSERMLKSPRVSAFAQEFLGQWLRYRDFPVSDPIIGEAFPEYDDILRAAMAEEPVRLMTHIIHEDRPITDLLSSDDTFVNRRLADHYGGVIQKKYFEGWNAFDGNRTRSNEIWLPVKGIHHEGRSGLLGMAVVLTTNSAGERTSPVKRGFWTAHHLLGQHFPPPPADVPELPKSENEATDTIRELLAAHVEDSKCAMCHKHFDGLGLAMEGFDAIGRRRTVDRAGRVVDNRTELPGGASAQGIPELAEYILQQRRDEFLKTFCRKFLGYALGRSVILSDEPLLMEMEQALKRHDDRFSLLFETVILSQQFRCQRGEQFVKDR